MPYKGSAEVVQGLLTGSVDFIIDGVASGLPLIQSGKFRPLAKLNDRPLPPTAGPPTLAVAADLPQLERHFELDRPCRAGRHAARHHRENPAGGLHSYADPAVAEKLDKAGINAVANTPKEIRRILPLGGRPLDQDIQGQRDQDFNEGVCLPLR